MRFVFAAQFPPSVGQFDLFGWLAGSTATRLSPAALSWHHCPWPVVAGLSPSRHGSGSSSVPLPDWLWGPRRPPGWRWRDAWYGGPSAFPRRVLVAPRSWPLPGCPPVVVRRKAIWHRLSAVSNSSASMRYRSMQLLLPAMSAEPLGRGSFLWPAAAGTMFERQFINFETGQHLFHGGDRRDTVPDLSGDLRDNVEHDILARLDRQPCRRFA